MKKESNLNELNSKENIEDTINPENSNTPKRENIISIKELIDKMINHLDELYQEKKWTDAEIKQFEYLGGKDNIDEVKKEAEEKISPTVQKIKDLIRKTKKAIIMLATVANLNSQVEAMNDKALNSDFNEDIPEANVNLDIPYSFDNPIMINYDDYINPIFEPELTQPIDPNQEPVLDGQREKDTRMH
jgi:hypothetical protein